ncbi:MAG: hypothetical protein WBQ37_09505 [Candidatus Competibacter sp.]
MTTIRRETKQNLTSYLSRPWQKALGRFDETPSIYRIGFILALLLLFGLIFAAVDLTPDLAHMRVTVLSGPENGQDYALVEELAREAEPHRGTVLNIATAGTAASLARLAKERDQRDSLFALAPDGLSYARPEKLELVARLPRSRTLFMLGAHADTIRYPSDLVGFRIGIGPHGSATALLARELLGSKLLKELEITSSEHPFTEQIDQLKQEKLDLGLFLMDADASLIEQAVRGGLQIASFDNAESLSAHIPALKGHTLYTGHFGQLRRLPQTNKKVFQTDLLMLSNGEASRSETVAMLVLLDTVFKGFIEINRSTPNETGLREARDLKPFLKNGGPSLLDEYAPRIVDLMPPANILHYVVLISLLFNAAVIWHRFRLWRIDANWLKLKGQTFDLFGHNYTIEEIGKLHLEPGAFSTRQKERLDELIRDLQLLRPRISQFSVSLIVPMGAEYYYRQQERMVDDALRALRQLRASLTA